MPTYHINNKGEKAICGAKKRKCRFTPLEASNNSTVQPNEDTNTAAPVQEGPRKPQLSARQLEDAVKNDIRGWDNLEYGSTPNGSPGRIITVDGVEHHIEHVSTTGGGEGGPEHVEVVFKLDGQLWLKEGRYSSYDGTDYEYGALNPVREAFHYETKYYSDDSAFQANPPVKDVIEKSGPGWSRLYPWSNLSIVHDGNTYNVEVVADIGGEGEGSYAAIIFKVNGELWRKEGHYSSYDATDYSFGLLEKVTAQQDYVTYYEPISGNDN